MLSTRQNAPHSALPSLTRPELIPRQPWHPLFQPALSLCDRSVNTILFVFCSHFSTMAFPVLQYRSFKSAADIIKKGSGKEIQGPLRLDWLQGIGSKAIKPQITVGNIGSVDDRLRKRIRNVILCSPPLPSAPLPYFPLLPAKSDEVSPSG